MCWTPYYVILYVDCERVNTRRVYEIHDFDNMVLNLPWRPRAPPVQ